RVIRVRYPVLRGACVPCAVASSLPGPRAPVPSPGRGPGVPLREGAEGVVQDGLPGEFGGADQAVVGQRAGQDGDAAAAPPQAAVGDDGAQPVRVGVQQRAVQAAEDDPVGVEDVHQSGQAQAQAVDQTLRCGADGRVVVVLADQGVGVLQQGHLGAGCAAGRGQEGQRVRLDVEAATAAAVAGPAAGADRQVTDLQGESGAAGVQSAVEDQRAADAAVAGGHAQQVPGAASGAVPVF